MTTKRRLAIVGVVVLIVAAVLITMAVRSGDTEEKATKTSLVPRPCMRVVFQELERR